MGGCRELELPVLPPHLVGTLLALLCLMLTACQRHVLIPVAYEGGVCSNYRSVHRGDKHGTATDTIRVTTQFYQRGWRSVGKSDHGSFRARTCQRPAENAQDLAVESLCPRL